jgi:sulfane dehydrogenase subunit SoxC
MTSQSARRRFLKDSVALAGMAVAGVRSASGQTAAPESPAPPSKSRREYGERSRFENSVRVLGQWGPRSPLQESVGIITPSSLHFMAAHGYEPPDIDPEKHRLLIHGLVNRSLIFTLEELKRLPSVSRIHFIDCGGNTGRASGASEASSCCGGGGRCWKEASRMSTTREE